MRVIKQGDLRFGHEGQWHCPRCGCEWEMDGADAPPARMSDQRDGDAYHMPCPTCKEVVYRAIPPRRDFYR